MADFTHTVKGVSLLTCEAFQVICEFPVGEEVLVICPLGREVPPAQVTNSSITFHYQSSHKLYVTRTEMVVCKICYTRTSLQSLSCGCMYCKDCLYEWFKDQLKSFFQDDLQIVCPSSTVRHPIADEDILRACSTAAQTSEVTSLLLKRTLLRLSDTRSCPNTSCSYIGWLDLSHLCLSSVECPACHTTWKEMNVYPWYLRVLVMLVKAVFGLQEEESNEVWKWMWTKNCPNCNVAIEKNGGCSNMNCYKCKTPFCWTCLKMRKDHRTGTCFLIYSYSVLTAVVLTVAVLLKIATVEPLFWYPLSVLAYCAGFLVFCVILMITIGVTMDSLNNHNSLLGILAWWVVFLLLTYLLFTSSLSASICAHFGAIALLAVHSLPLLLYLRVLER